MVEVRGEVDLATAPRLRERLFGLIDQGSRNVVVNLTNVAFIDSAGLGVLVATMNRLQEGDGTLRLAGAAESARRVLSVTGLDRMFPVYESVAEATGAGG